MLFLLNFLVCFNHLSPAFSLFYLIYHTNIITYYFSFTRFLVRTLFRLNDVLSPSP